jgi:hypothetical protein
MVDDQSMKSHISYSNVAATLALLLAIGGGSYALAASGGNTITACAKKKGGALRIASRCRRGERKLSWNKVGPRGLQGPGGLQGPPGVAGTPAVVTFTTLPQWGGALTDPNGDLVWRLQRNLGSFDKQSATTHAIVFATGELASFRYSCYVQVRVDGNASDGTAPAKANGTTNPSAAGVHGPGQPPTPSVLSMPFSITADFGALPAGTHAVTLWTAGNDANNQCSTDYYSHHDGTTTVLEVGK